MYFIYRSACNNKQYPIPPTLRRLPFMREHLKKMTFPLIQFTLIRDILALSEE